MTKKLITIAILALVLLAGTTAPASAETVDEALGALVEYYEENKPRPDHWEEIVGLGRAGEKIDLSQWKVELNEESQPAAYASTILALEAAGLEPRNYNGKNLVDELVGMQEQDGGFGAINHTIYAIIALDKVNANYNAVAALTNLIDRQNQEQKDEDYGGFGYPGWGYDPDTTGMALSALASHGQNSAAAQAVDRALVFLKNKQLPDGSFGHLGSGNAASTATVIQGLVACGKDVFTWGKGNNSIIKALFGFRLAGGAFSHQQGGAADDFSTRQALVAVAELVQSGGYGDQKIPFEVIVSVEGNDRTLDRGLVVTGDSALAALEKLVEDNYTVDGDGGILSIHGEKGRSVVGEVYTTAWRYYVFNNGKPDPKTYSMPPGEYPVHQRDEIVFYIGAHYEDPGTQSVVEATYIPVVNITPSAPTAGQTLNVSVTAMVYNPEEGGFSTASIDPINVLLNQSLYTTSWGQAQIPLDRTGTVTCSVYKQHPAGYPELVRNSRQLTIGKAVDKRVHVRVEGLAGKLASGPVEVTGTALDALRALVGEDNVLEFNGFITAILDEPSGNLSADTATGWKYYVIKGGDIDESSLNTGAAGYNLAPGDEVVFYHGAHDPSSWSGKTYPSLVKLHPAAPRAGDNVQVNIDVKEYVWSQGLTDREVADVKLSIDGREQVVTAGRDTVEFTAAEGKLDIRAEKYHDLGYPVIVPSEVALVIPARDGGGGGDGINIKIKVRDKQREIIYSGRVVLAAGQPNNPIYALQQTGLAVKTSYGGSYVYSIDGIAEDSGGTAGWKYKVNGVTPGTVAADEYKLEDGDEVEWFWALDAGDEGSGQLPPQEPVNQLPGLPPERLEALAEAREKVARELARLALDLTGLPPAGEELYHRVELARYPVVVVNLENTITAEELEKWRELLDENRVAVTGRVDSGAHEITDGWGEVSLVLTGGSLPGEATIEIYELTGPGAAPPDTHRLVTPVYDLGPDGLQFQKPVTLRIKITDWRPAPENLVLAWYDPANDRWVPAPTVVDLAGGEVSGLITHFTQFAVLAREKQPIAFSDVDNGEYHWARQEIQYLALKEIVSGTGEGNFSPSRPVTRAEFVAMLANAMDLWDNREESFHFTDVDKDAWYHDALQAVTRVGLVKGFSDGAFRPHELVTREQIAAIAARTLDIKPSAAELGYADWACITLGQGQRYCGLGK